MLEIIFENESIATVDILEDVPRALRKYLKTINYTLISFEGLNKVGEDLEEHWECQVITDSLFGEKISKIEVWTLEQEQDINH